MTWEEKLAILKDLDSTTCLEMRKPGDWYVRASLREVKKDVMLHGSYGNGRSPQEAVEDDWRIITSLPENEHIVIDAYSNRRKAYRWDGYYWANVVEKKQEENHG